MNHSNTWVNDHINKILWIIKIWMHFFIIIERINFKSKRLNENLTGLRFLSYRNDWFVNLFGALNIWCQLVLILIQRSTNYQKLENFHQELLSFLLVKNAITFWFLHKQAFSYFVANLNSFKILAHTFLNIIAFYNALFLELIEDL